MNYGNGNGWQYSVGVDEKDRAKIGRAPKCSYKRRLLTFLSPMEKTNGVVCGEVRGVHWRVAFDYRIIFWIKFSHKQSRYLIGWPRIYQ